MRRRVTAGVALVLLLVPAACSARVDPQSTPTTAASTPTDDTGSAPGSESRKVTMIFGGDVLVHEGVWIQAQKDAQAEGMPGMTYDKIFAGIRPAVSGADLAVCHMETPTAPREGPYENFPLFAAPPQVLTGLTWAGFDGCTTASNHSVDQGFDGLVRTIDDLDAAGLAHTGTWAKKREYGDAMMLEANGVSVAVLSATFSTNGMPVTNPWSVQMINTDELISQAAQLKAAGVDVVAVAIHCCVEYVTAPAQQQLDVFDALTASPDIDFVYGHHAHVVQPWDKVNGKWVVYGLGNMVALQEPDNLPTWRGQLAQITFKQRPDGSFKAVHPGFRPIFISSHYTWHEGTRVYDTATMLAQDPPPALASQLRHAQQIVRDEVKRKGVRMLGPVSD